MLSSLSGGWTQRYKTKDAEWAVPAGWEILRFHRGAGSAITSHSLNHSHLLLWQNMSTGIFRSLLSLTTGSWGEKEWKSDETQCTHSFTLCVCVYDWQQQMVEWPGLSPAEYGVSSDPRGGHQSPLDTISNLKQFKQTCKHTQTQYFSHTACKHLISTQSLGDLNISGDKLWFSKRWLWIRR